MIRQVSQQLRPLLRRPRLDLFSIGVVSAVSGILQAAVLVLVVNAAVVLAEGATDAPVGLPVVGIEASLSQVLWTAIVLAVVVALVNGVLARQSAGIGCEVLQAARHRTIASYLSASWEQQSTEREGSIQETVTTLSTQSSNLAMGLIGIVAGSLGLAALFVTALFIDVSVTMVVLAFGAILFGLLRPLGALTRRRARAYVEANSRYAEDITRMVSMSMELRVFGAEAPTLDSLDDANRSVSELLRRSSFAARFGTSLFRDVAVIFLVVAVGALNVTGGDRLVEIGAVALLIVRSLAYATSVQSFAQQVRVQAPALSSLTERTERLAAHVERSGTAVVSSFDVIELAGVTYSYDARTPALRDVDLTIKAREVLGVVGPSGSGKSTLLQVLLRLRRPVSGAVLVDGRDYAEIDPGSWSSLVAFVPQEPRLMEASIADNIAFMRKGVTRADVERAAADAHVDEEIRALPSGFDTVLGPLGSGLSGGQKQRVAFARALVGRPRLLILDEPTSALDIESERRIQETISELKDRVTLVIVAHRLSTLDVCDRVVSIRDGRIEPADLPNVSP